MTILHIASSFIVLSLILCILHALPTTGGSALDLYVKLIHRDSPESPLYDPTSTPFSRFRATVRRSAHRANYFRNIIAKSHLLNAVDNYLISSDISKYDSDYMMEFYMGGPAKYRQKVRAMLDTGSSLTWVLCNPCKKCHKPKIPIFNPMTSNTYKKIQCKSHACSFLPHSPCRFNSLCKFNIAYGDDSAVNSLLSEETIGFDSSDGKIKVRVPGILFGCTHMIITGTFNNAGIGIVGLNGGNLSLTRQLNLAIGIATKFSYCLPKHNDKSSRIYFGSASDASGLLAMSPYSNHYYLKIEDIVVSGPNDMPFHFAMKQEKGPHSKPDGYIMIDSATTFTFIEEKTMIALLEKVNKIVNRSRVEVPKEFAKSLDLCFDWSDPVEKKLRPRFTFNFDNNMELEVSKPFGLVKKNIYCLTIASNRHMHGMSVLGNRAHTGYRAIYDLQKPSFTIIPNAC